MGGGLRKGVVGEHETTSNPRASLLVLIGNQVHM